MKPVSKLLLPPKALSGCIFAGIYRDTRGADLSASDRLNHFPASPLISISVLYSGTLYLLSEVTGSCELESRRLDPGVSVAAPTDGPVTSWAKGEVRALSIGFYPDAWIKLGGDAAADSLPASIGEALDALSKNDDLNVAWPDFCHALDLAWRAARASTNNPISGIKDWTRAIVADAIHNGRGKSLRSLERRIKRWSGQSKRSLEFYASVEDLHRISRERAGSPLAEIALEAGYSDQSHMGRALSRATGFSPARLNKAIEGEEAFWCYRLLGERF